LYEISNPNSTFQNIAELIIWQDKAAHEKREWVFEYVAIKNKNKIYDCITYKWLRLLQVSEKEAVCVKYNTLWSLIVIVHLQHWDYERQHNKKRFRRKQDSLMWLWLLVVD